MTSVTIIGLLARGAALIGLVGIAALVLRRASAAHRHLVWTLGSAGLLALPLAWLAIPSLTLSLANADATRGEVLVASDSTVMRVAAPAAPVVPAPPAPMPPLDASPPSRAAPSFVPVEAEVPATPAALRPATPVAGEAPNSAAALGWVWLAGVLLSLAPFFAGSLAVLRLLRRSRRLDDPATLALAADARARLGLRRPVRLVVSRRVESPLTVGAIRPVVVLPACALEWPAERVTLALLHEFAHVRRRDLLAERVAGLAAALHWPNPLAWLSVSRLRVERERACDDLVLRSGRDATEYAGFLVSLARAAGRKPRLAAVAAAMAGCSQLRRRVGAILDSGRRRLGPSRRAGVVFAAMALVALLLAAAVTPSPAVAGDGEKSVTVTTSRTYSTLAEAIEAAPPGSVVRIGPGVWQEHLVVTKPLTIEGAGAGETTILAEVYSAETTRKIWEEFSQQRGPVSTDEERAAYTRELLRRYDDVLDPVLEITGTGGVVLRNLTLKGLGERPDGGVASGSVVDLRDAEVRLEKVAVIGSPGAGVTIRDGARVQIEGCLVAQVWGTGIAVHAAGDRPPVVRITDCDIRACWHRGITVARGNRNVRIEGCRISGSSLHGIRYDDAAPVIRGNLIFGNESSGIYASGRTEGRIEGNLFFENGMSDVSCWFGNRDVIEGNTFVRAKRESLAILGGSDPVVRRNVFAECVVAVRCGGHTGGDDGTVDYGGGGTVARNVFYGNGTDFQHPGEGRSVPVDIPSGNRILDPEFADAPNRDFSVPLELGAGVVEAPAFESPWPDYRIVVPPFPQEVPKPETPEVLKPEAPQVRKPVPILRDARPIGTQLTEDILQKEDLPKRNATVAKMREALASGDPVLEFAGLIAFTGTLGVGYDVAEFRELILPLTDRQNAHLQIAAFYALAWSGVEEGDLQLLLDRTVDASPFMRNQALAHLINLFSKGDISGPSAERVLAIFADPDAPHGHSNTFRGLWKARVSPELETRILELARHPPARLVAIQTIGTFPDKSEAAVRALIDAIDDDSCAGFAQAGLELGVPDECRKLVADAFLKLILTERDAEAVLYFLRRLAEYGDASHIEALVRIAENESADEDVRVAARDSIGVIEDR